MNINLVNKGKVYNFDIPTNATLKYIKNLASKLQNSCDSIFDIKYKNLKFSDYPENKLFSELITDEDSIIYLTITEKDSLTNTCAFSSEKETGREKQNTSKKNERYTSPKNTHSRNAGQINNLIYKPLVFTDNVTKKKYHEKIDEKILTNSKKQKQNENDNKIFENTYDKKEKEISSLMKILNDIVKEKDNYLYKKKQKIIKTDEDELPVLEKKIREYQERRVKYIKKLINDLNNENDCDLGEDYLSKFYKDIDNYALDETNTNIKKNYKRSSTKQSASVDYSTTATNNDVMNKNLVSKNNNKKKNSVNVNQKINDNNKMIELKKNLQKSYTISKEKHNSDIIKCSYKSSEKNCIYKPNKIIKSKSISNKSKSKNKLEIKKLNPNDINQKKKEKIEDIVNKSSSSMSSSNMSPQINNVKKTTLDNNYTNKLLKTEDSANKRIKSILPLLNINKTKKSKKTSYLFGNKNYSKEANVTNSEINEDNKKRNFIEIPKTKSKYESNLNHTKLLELINETDSEYSRKRSKNKICLTKNIKNENKEKLVFSEDENKEEKSKNSELKEDDNEENDYNNIKNQQTQKEKEIYISKIMESNFDKRDIFKSPSPFHLRKRGYSKYYQAKSNKAIKLRSNRHSLSIFHQKAEENEQNNVNEDENNLKDSAVQSIKIVKKKRRPELVDNKFDFII